jgi:uncharacterized protein (DUF362 family)
VKDGMPIPVSLVKYEKRIDSLKKTIELCEGFKDLKKSSKILIKPNILTWSQGTLLPPYGVYTTTALVEDLVILLKEFGCNNINIGEGAVAMTGKSDTPAVFKGLGYENLAEKYNIKLVDLNESPTKVIKVNDEITYNLAADALDTDFFINFPVLKTHSQTKVSLSIKNLKGCLKTSSKKACHHPKLSLEHCFQFLPDYIKPKLNIIDGIYALERGPLYWGNAYRKNIIIASKDIVGADIVAAKSIGYNAEDISHIKEYAQRTNHSIDLKDYAIRGESLDKNITPLKWDWAWTKENTGPGIFEKMGIKGLAIQKYDETLCSGCSPISNMTNIFILSAFKGEPLPSVEIINGKRTQARPGYDKTLLLGNCIIKANETNKNIKEAIKVKGCPPSEQDLVNVLKSLGLKVKDSAYQEYIEGQAKKYDGKPEFTWDFYKVQ